MMTMTIARLCVVVALAVVVTAGHDHTIPTFLHRTSTSHPGELMHLLSDEFQTPLKSKFYHSLDEYYGSSAYAAYGGYVAVKTSTTKAVNGENVTVSWTGVPTSAVRWNDWIGVYSPANSNVTDFLDFIYVNESSTWAQGYGSHNLRLFNMRDDYGFKYFSNRTYDNILLAESLPVTFPKYEALHVHIATTGVQGEMRIMWNSNSTEVPVVQYGSVSGVYPYNASGNSSTYTADMLCEAPANTTSAITFRNPGMFHDVLLTGLKPGAVYHYIVGASVWSAEFNFTAPPVVGPNQNVTFITYGDMGVAYEPSWWYMRGSTMVAAAVADEIAAGGAEMVYHVGDLSYAVGHQFIWDQFGTMISKFAAYVPTMMGIGNHEYDHEAGGQNDPSHAPGNGFHPSWGNYNTDSRGECGVPTVHRYHMPDGSPGSLQPFWYSYDHASIHFIMMSTEHNFTKGSDQYKWIEQDLQSVNKTVTPWVVMGGHRPLYMSQVDQDSDMVVSLYLRDAIEDLLYTYRVNLMITGHYHSYMRSCPVYRGVCQKNGQATTHVVVGMAGATLDPPDIFEAPWSAYGTDTVFGYMRVEVTPDNMAIQLINAHNSTVVDRAVILPW